MLQSPLFSFGYSKEPLNPVFRSTAPQTPMERCSIFVGTTNQDEFLSDSTGNRRFWIVPVVKNIDIGLLKTERDRIWAAAAELYKNGEQWWLTDLEEAAADAITENFKTSDPWTPIIAAYLSDKDSTTTNQVMQEALQLDISKRDPGMTTIRAIRYHDRLQTLA